MIEHSNPVDVAGNGPVAAAIRRQNSYMDRWLKARAECNSLRDERDAARAETETWKQKYLDLLDEVQHSRQISGELLEAVRLGVV